MIVGVGQTQVFTNKIIESELDEETLANLQAALEAHVWNFYDTHGVEIISTVQKALH